MAGPWEKYQPAAAPTLDPAPATGPWAKYQTAPTAAVQPTDVPAPAVEPAAPMGLGEAMFTRLRSGLSQSISGTQEMLGEGVDKALTSNKLMSLMFNLADDQTTADAMLAPNNEALAFAKEGAGISAAAREDSQYSQDARGVSRPTSFMDAVERPGNAAEFYGGIVSESAGPMLASMATRNPELATGVMGAMTAAPQYSDARESGQSVEDSFKEATLVGMIESALGMSPFGEAFSKAPMAKRLVRTTATEAGTEGITGAGQLLAENEIRGKKTAPSDTLASLIDSMIVGTAMGPSEALLGGGGDPAAVEQTPAPGLNDLMANPPNPPLNNPAAPDSMPVDPADELTSMLQAAGIDPIQPPAALEPKAAPDLNDMMSNPPNPPLEQPAVAQPVPPPVRTEGAQQEATPEVAGAPPRPPAGYRDEAPEVTTEPDIAPGGNPRLDSSGRPMRKLAFRQDKDDLLTWVASQGGINADAAREAGIDLEQFKGRSNVLARGVPNGAIVKRGDGGMTADQLRERMQEQGWLEADPESGTTDVSDNDALDLLWEASNRRVLHPHNNANEAIADHEAKLYDSELADHENAKSLGTPLKRLRQDVSRANALESDRADLQQAIQDELGDSPVTDDDLGRYSPAELADMVRTLKADRHRDHVNGTWTSIGNAVALVEREADLPPARGVVDLDNFKNLNDTHGHAFGDVVLRGVGAILGQHFGNGFTFRKGGDEYTVAGSDPETVAKTLKAAQDDIASAVFRLKKSDGSDVEVTGVGMSFGVGIDEDQADANQSTNKQERADAGLRQPRSATDRRQGQDVRGTPEGGSIRRSGVNDDSQPGRVGEEVPDSNGRGRGQQSLLPAATGREVTDGARRAKDDQRNGRNGTGRSDMLAGDGELFAGPRPEQTDIENDQPKTQRRDQRAEQTEASRELNRKFNLWLKSKGRGKEEFRSREVPKSALSDALRRALSAIGEATGLTVTVIENRTPEVESFNGLTFRDGHIYIDSKATQPATLVAAHEFVHELRRSNPELYNVLADEIARQGNLPKWAKRMASEKNDTSPDGVIEELTADAVADALTDPDFLRRLAERDQSAFQRVARAFLDFLDTLLDKIQNRGTNEYLADVQAFRDKLLDVLDRVGKGEAGGDSAPVFQRRDESARDLVAAHSTTASKLRHAMRMGGFAVPSLAITKGDAALDNFGDITLIGSESLIDPKRGAKTFGADAYSPRYPSVEFKVERKVAQRVVDELRKFDKDGKGIEDRIDTDDMAGWLRRQDAFKAYADAKSGGTANWTQLNELSTDMLRRNGAEERIFNGYTHGGKRRYKAHTLDNVVAILKKEIRGGESGGSGLYGVGALRAKYTPQFRSVASIRKAKGSLVSKENFETIKEEVDKDLFAISDRVSSYYDGDANRFGFIDTVLAVIEDSAKMGIPSALNEYGFSDVPQDVKEQIAQFMTRLRTMPTEYFESNMPRAVDVSEFTAAVVPNDTDADVIKSLEDRGIVVSKYPAGDTNARRAAVKDAAESSDVMFQRREASDQIKPLTESKFQSQYAQHIDIHGRKSGNASEARDAALREGFKSSGRANAVPPYTGGKPDNIVQRAYMPKAGDVVYLAPRDAWENTPNGMAIKNGWKPKPWEAIVVSEDGASMYHEYLREFDGANPDIRMQRREGDLSPAQREFMRKAGMADAVDTRTSMQRVTDWAAGKLASVKELDSDEGIQATLDRFHGIAAAVRAKGNISVDRNPYIAARLSTGTASTMEAILLFGAPKWEGGVLSIDRKTAGLLEAFSPVRDAMPAFLGWMVARRAEVMKKQGRENLMSDADIAAGLSLAKGRESDFTNAALGYLKIKNAVLKVAEEAGTINAADRALWDHAEYIPFYRDMDAGRTGAGTQQAIANQSAGIKRLKGGEQSLKDPLSNIIENLTRLIDSATKNRAVLLAVDELGEPYFRPAAKRLAQATIPLSAVKKHLLDNGTPQDVIDRMPKEALDGVARLLSIEAPQGPDIVRVMRDGKAEYHHVDDPLLLRALTAFKEVDKNIAVKPLVWLKQLLTAGATMTPEFAVANTLRDTGEAWVTSRDGFIPLVDTLRGAASRLADSPLSQDLMMAGAAFQGGLFHTSDSKDTAKAIHRALRKGKVDESKIKAIVSSLWNPARAWDVYRKLLESSEMGSRIMLAQRRLDAGATKIEAMFEAKDFLDFSMRGDARFIELATDILPFLNARLQGNYRLARVAGVGGDVSRRAKLLGRMGVMAMFSAALFVWNATQYADDYDELEEWDKDAYWHIGPGTDWHLRIPKPFEIGLIAGTGPERIGQAILFQATDGEAGDRPDQSAMAMFHALFSTLAINPIPQGVRPALESYVNFNFFTGRAIENMGDEQKLPEDRYTAFTSETMREVGRVTGTSPKQLENLWRGYTAGMGMYLLDSSDWLLRTLRNDPEQPEKALRDYPLIGRFMRGGDPQRSIRQMTEFYDLKEQADKRTQSIKEAVVRGDLARARRLEDGWAWLLGPRVASKRAKGGFMHSNVQIMNKLASRLADARREDQFIMFDPKLTAAQKRARMVKLTKERNAEVKKMVRILYNAKHAAH